MMKRRIENDPKEAIAFTEATNFTLSAIKSYLMLNEHPIEFIQRISFPIPYQNMKKYDHHLAVNVQTKKSNFIVGLDQEIRLCTNILSRKTKNNILLIGERGVGKKSIVKGLAQRVVHQDVLSVSKRLIVLNMEELIANTNYPAQLEEHLRSILKEIQSFNNDIILFINKIHLFFYTENSEGITAVGNLLKRMLVRGELHCIGTTTPDTYRKYIEKDSVFEKHFQQVLVKEPSTSDCISILRGLKDYYESHFCVQLLDSTLITAVQLSHHYITDRFLPDKAIHLIDEACRNIRVQFDSQPEIISQLERQEFQLNVEIIASSQKQDEVSKQHFKQIKEELFKIQEELKSVKLKYKIEKERINELSKLKPQLKSLEIKLLIAERENNLELVNDMKSQIIPDLERKIAETEHQITEENKQQQQQQQQDRLLTKVVEPNAITKIVSQWTGIAVSQLLQTKPDSLSQLSEHLHGKIIGQDVAINSVAETVFRNRTGRPRQNQPIGSFLFLGPTGVGKTQLAKTLALELFDSTESMIRINMSAYTESYSVDRLIDTFSNYIGFEQGSQLTEVVRQKPYGIILFDEIDKAHPEIWNTLLEILHNGSLTDGNGQTIDLTNTIIILTSNIGVQYILEQIQNSTSSEQLFDEKLSQAIKEHIMKEVDLHFQPEFLNHLDNIIFFQPLNINQLTSILHLQIKSFEERFKEQHMTISLTDKTIESIVKKSYNPVYGAHPLKRYLEKYILTQLLKLSIQMKLTPYCHVKIDNDGNDYQYRFDIQEFEHESMMEIDADDEDCVQPSSKRIKKS